VGWAVLQMNLALDGRQARPKPSVMRQTLPNRLPGRTRGAPRFMHAVGVTQAGDAQRAAA
jgi:hypothetical protein